MAKEASPYSSREVDGVHVIRLGPTASDRMIAEKIERTWNRLLPTLDPPILVIDFSDVPHASSALLGAIVGLYWQVAERNGRMRLCSVAPSIQEVFQVTRLQKRLAVDPDVETALREIKKP